ncbi:MAG: type II secretion system secretin GspD [Polyangiaceae bacterium]
MASRFGVIGGALLALLVSSPFASAQPSRGNPIIRTPPKPGQPAAPTSPDRRLPGAPGAAGTPAPGTPAAPAQPGGTGNQPAGPGQAVKPGGGAADDPMSNVKQGTPEIEFKPKPGGDKVNFNLEEADLVELVKAISNLTGRRFIYGGKLRQIKATVYSPEKVTVAEAYQAFLSILETNNLTVIPQGRFLKIIETPGVVSQTTPIIGTATPVPVEDRYVTRLYRVNTVDAGEVANVLNKFKSKDGDISTYPGGNLLIITDTGSNIQRMLRIVEEVDQGGGAGDQLWYEPVHYGSASEVATKLNEILDLKAGGAGAAAGGAAGRRAGAGGAASVGGARIIPDDRTNSLVITATQADYLRLLELIKRMDVPQSGEGEIHVLPLQHAACKDLSTTLNQILGGATAAPAAAPGGRGATAARPAGGGAAGGGSEDIFEGAVRVTCDEATNSLVTTSSLRDYAQLRAVINKLDQPRRQVFIEAVIMDVGVTRTLDFGVGYHAGSSFETSEGPAFYYGGNNPGQSITGVPANLEALALGLKGPELSGSTGVAGVGVSIPAFGVVMHALAKDGNTNVLATPHILCTDNIKAEISIGQNIPLQTNVGGSLGSLASLAGGAGQQAGAASALSGLLGGGMGFNAPRQDVGTKVTVTPHVNDSDQVRLELQEEISEAGVALGALGAIPINKRTASTTLIVRDQQTVVIGGLMRDSVTEGETKIPVLGDIPVLGFLFRQSNKSTSKSNLLLVLTPYVIRDQDDLRAIFERKMQERQEFLDRYFVFNDGMDWKPPRDFARANGLVEDIRQQILAQEEKLRLEEEAKPRGPQTHEPGDPIALPSIHGAGGRATTGAAPGAVIRDDGDGPATPAPPAPGMGPGSRRLRPGNTPQRNVERVE